MGGEYELLGIDKATGRDETVEVQVMAHGGFWRRFLRVHRAYAEQLWRCPSCHGVLNIERRWAGEGWRYRCYDCGHRWSA